MTKHDMNLKNTLSKQIILLNRRTHIINKKELEDIQMEGE